jgi:N-methylhydantoinase A
MGERLRIDNVLAFDMGGTTAKASLIEDGAISRGREYEVGGAMSAGSRLIRGAGELLRIPTIDIAEVGAGGGSIAWIDPAGGLQVGPRSAGADPGPACYGRGGVEPTVTDANLLLDRLPDRLAGGLELDRDAAERALGEIDPADVVDVVNAEMLGALRVVSVERGHDPAEFALVAFGGAGPLHACELADELGIATVLVPAAAGVLSALGLAGGDERRDRVRSYLCRLEDAGELPEDGEADLRYAGQSFELTVPIEPDLADAFHRAHEARYGYADPARPVELVAVRTADVVAGPAFELPAGEAREIAGPARLELDGATCWVPEGWTGESAAGGSMVLQR